MDIRRLCRTQVLQMPRFTNADFSGLRFWLRFGSGFGDDQGYASVVDSRSRSKRYCMFSVRLYQLVSLDHFQQ